MNPSFMLAAVLGLSGTASPPPSHPAVAMSPVNEGAKLTAKQFTAAQRTVTFLHNGASGTRSKSSSSSQLKSHGLRCEEAPIAPALWDCPDPEPQDTTVTTVTITPGQVLTAAREIGLAAGRVSIQPSKGTTLVNLPTILSTQDTTLDKTVTLLGTRVEVRGTPVTYLWRHGDGTTQRTRNPGRPYPHKDITHRYLKPAKRVEVSVDITYRVSYRIGDGGWQELTDTITTRGPATALAVREVIPVLIHGDD